MRNRIDHEICTVVNLLERRARPVCGHYSSRCPSRGLRFYHANSMLAESFLALQFKSVSTAVHMPDGVLPCAAVQVSLPKYISKTEFCLALQSKSVYRSTYAIRYRNQCTLIWRCRIVRRQFKGKIASSVSLCGNITSWYMGHACAREL